MELRGIGTTRCRCPVGAIPPTALENRANRSITIYPIVGSRSNFFHEFPKAIFDGVAWNRYDTLTASGLGHSSDNAREPGQKVYNIDPTVGSHSNFFHDFPEAFFDGVAWNRYDTLTVSGQGHSTDDAREPGQKVHNYRSDRWIALKFFSRVYEGCFRGS